MDISELIRPNIKALKPYSSARDEFEGHAHVFLDANENPFASDFNRYPDPHQRELKKRIAFLKKAKEEQIFVGNGSDEAIDLLLRAFCIPSVDEVVILQPTYGMYSVSANINHVKIKTAQLTSDFDIDVQQSLSLVTPNTKIIFLCSPNNPTGNVYSANKIEALLKQFNGLVIVDEAYIDFTSSPSWIEQLARFKNLVVLQTLSKAWGLAGLRLGLCFAHPEIISVLNKIKPPYNISGLAQAMALQALHKNEQKENQVREILSQRSWLTEQLKDLKNIIHVFPSEANFLLVKIMNAQSVYQKLVSKGIVVRDRSSMIGCEDCLRITVGTVEENQELINELKII